MRPQNTESLKIQAEEPFRLDPLPYSYDALEPVIDHQTLEWHHDVYHRRYVDRLNQIVASLPGFSAARTSLDEILGEISRFPDEVRDCAGGHWNHSFFWSVMTDRKEDHEISPDVLHAIERSFGSLEHLKAEFVKAGCQRTGSGWIWLVKSSEQRLRIMTTANNDNPLMDLCVEPCAPVLVCDLWEHAYFQKFKGRREEFLRLFFALINWSRVHQLFVGQVH